MGFVRTVGALAITLLLAACGGSDPGSREELSEQLDDLKVPIPMVMKDDTYVAECPATGCPSYVRWYDVIGEPAAVQPGIVHALEEKGFDVNEASMSPRILTARSDEHILFVVLDPDMISTNEFAPANSEAEISIQLLDSYELGP